jgi:hypothetical protein
MCDRFIQNGGKAYGKKFLVECTSVNIGGGTISGGQSPSQESIFIAISFKLAIDIIKYQVLIAKTIEYLNKKVNFS